MPITNIQFATGISGQTLDAIVWNNIGQVYYPSLLGFVDYLDVDYANYVVTLVERGTSGHYYANLPDVVLGSYEVEIKKRQGITPLENDLLVGIGTINSCDFIAEPITPVVDTECPNGVQTSTLLESLNNPQSITVDGRSISEHSLADIIALDKHLAAKHGNCNGSGGWGAIGIRRASMPGGNGNC
jgi:hypothetical protein